MTISVDWTGPELDWNGCVCLSPYSLLREARFVVDGKIQINLMAGEVISTFQRRDCYYNTKFVSIANNNNTQVSRYKYVRGRLISYHQHIT